MSIAETEDHHYNFQYFVSSGGGSGVYFGVYYGIRKGFICFIWGGCDHHDS